MKPSDPLTDSGKVAMAEVLLLDAQMALLFIRLAGTTSNPLLKKRRLKAAAKAYGRIIAFIPRVSLTGEQMALLERRLSILEAHLKAGVATPNETT